MTTGSEVFKGRIKDTFSPVIREKLAAFPSEEIGQIYVDDEKTHILEAIQKQIAAGADLIICTGGMSVDPDDCTRCHHGNRSKDCQLRCTGASGSDDACSYYTNEADGRVIPILGLRDASCMQNAQSLIWCCQE